jgi:hypothetical protein
MRGEIDRGQPARGEGGGECGGFKGFTGFVEADEKVDPGVFGGEGGERLGVAVDLLGKTA